jgi:hypothetical protein
MEFCTVSFMWPSVRTGADARPDRQWGQAKWSSGMVPGTALLYSVSAVIHIVTVHSSNMNSKIYKTVLRIIMSAVTVTMSRSLLVLIVTF